MSSSMQGIEKSVGYDYRLPSRIFATDRYPNGRLNVYSRAYILSFIHKILKDTPEFTTIMNSCFGPLFEIPVSMCSVSCKLIHALLCRQVVTKKKYELWTVFGGQPLRFSLKEFGAVTGLPCGEFPETYDFEYQPSHKQGKNTFWDELIGEDRKTTLADVATMLEESKDMESSKKLRLALLLIVDGVLIATHQIHRPTLKYVLMLENIDDFLAFPWGRESFLKTISQMRPGKRISGKSDDPLQIFSQRLQQQSLRLQGFPLALQLLAFKSISGLLDKLPDGYDEQTFLQKSLIDLPKHKLLLLSDVHAIEQTAELVVIPLINVNPPPQEGWGDWDDEVGDEKVIYMEELINKGHVFSKEEWPGGVTSYPLILPIQKKSEVIHKRHIFHRSNRKTSGTKIISVKQSASKSKHRRSSQRLDVTDENSLDFVIELEEWMKSHPDALENNLTLEMQKLSQLSEHVTKLKKKLKANMFHRARRPSKFHGLLCFAKRKTRQGSKETQYPSPSAHGPAAVDCTSTPNITGSEKSEGYDYRLPSRIFATDRYPNGRLNVYSRAYILSFIHKILRGTPEFTTIMNSCFGPLFEIPVSMCSISCKLIHALLCRQLVTEKKYELWTVFGGQPLRFSLKEFGAVTGLPCGEFPETYDFEYQPSHKQGNRTFWDELIGEDRKTTLADVATMLEESKDMESSKKLRLALLLIVDGVLIAKHQIHRPTLKYVLMLENIDNFLAFPWGRESFLKTISEMRPGKRVSGKSYDPLQIFSQRLQQVTLRLQGFPLALQLWAFKSIPGLLDKLPDGYDKGTFLQRSLIDLPKHKLLLLSDVHAIEQTPDLVVIPLINVSPLPQEGWGEWDDEVRDEKVLYMENLINKGHVFSKEEWPGGVTSYPLILPKQKKSEMIHKRHIFHRSNSKKTGTRIISVKKQSASKSKHRSARRSSQSLDIPDDISRDFAIELEERMKSHAYALENKCTLKMKKVSELSDNVTKLKNKLKAIMFHRARRCSKFHRLSCFARRKTREASKGTQYPSSSAHGHAALGGTSTLEVHHQLDKYVNVFGVEPIMNVQSGSDELNHMDTDKSSEFQAAVCQICGDRGFVEALVHCDCCKIEVIHRYCLDIKPVPFLDYITWFCEECDADSDSDSEQVEHSYIVKKG